VSAESADEPSISPRLPSAGRFSMDDLLRPRPRDLGRALAALLLASAPPPALAAPSEPGPWLAHLAFVVAAVVVIVMLLREALSEPPDESPDADPERSAIRRYEARNRDAQRGSRSLA
jgi:hypothetical protein